MTNTGNNGNFRKAKFCQKLIELFRNSSFPNELYGNNNIVQILFRCH